MTKEARKNELERDLTKAHYKVVRKMAESLLSVKTSSRYMVIDENFRSFIFDLAPSPWANYVIIAFFLLGVYLPEEDELDEDKIIGQLCKAIRRAKNAI